ncbi:DNA-processing protein DprA [Methanoculleus sp. FWC-SCC1]|uniref:DNA-processing protein DprA n=1 Tax=Methanoculleus frigidifontis TaxID=2584085 RepID=A0ABT8M854_9EURY|nr:DNA-processing protein DprA [Methanoculleus sp. FWC-SCC1]MDN7024110.1 DNA-processing protein DprA [Methanoculleus sp. FWC-SCC1]
MNNLSTREIAFLAALNDSQLPKRQEYAEYFRDPAFLRDLYAAVFENDTDSLMAYPDHLRPLIARAEDLRERDLLPFFADTIAAYRQNGTRILPIFDAGYPKRLPEIPDPPLILYQAGREESIAKPAAAVVGTRRISSEGIARTREAVAILVRLGYVIVSGLALGTDTCAHTAALEFGGETIAVLPGDIEAVVPRQNRNLAVAITASGSLLSEITPLTKMHKGRYIERNRITSGLSEGVVVVETAASGGSVRQAEVAFRQGRPVYALKPDDSNTEAMAGYRRLVSSGAVPVESPHDLSQYFGKLQQSPASRATTLADFS